MDKGESMTGATIVSGCDLPEVLEFVEAALDPVPGLVDKGVVRVEDIARSAGRDDGGCPGGSDGLADVVAVMGPIGDDASVLDTVKGVGSAFALAVTPMKTLSST